MKLKKTKHSEKVRVLMILFVAVVFFLMAFPCLAQNGKANKVTVLVPASTASTPFFFLDSEDHEFNLDIVVEVFINHPQAMAKLLRGEVDLLFTGTSTGWENYLDKGPLMMINTGVWGVSYLIGKDPSIKSFSDLKGKHIALPFPGSPLDFQTRCILEKEGLDPKKDLTISYSPFTQTVSKLLMNQIDVAPLPEPLATNITVNKKLLRLIDYKKAWAKVSGGNEYSPQVSLFSKKEYCFSHKKIIRTLVDAWEWATEKTKNDPVTASKISEPYLNFPRNIIETAVKNTLYYIPDFQTNMELVTDYYEIVKEYIPGKRGRLKEDFFFNYESNEN